MADLVERIVDQALINQVVNSRSAKNRESPEDRSQMREDDKSNTN
jgi:hypothetical protein